MKTVVVLVEAAEDIESARTFYDGSEAGVGARFVDSLVADLVSLARLSGVHPVHFGFHRMLASRFPFGIYYREQRNETQVAAILDLRRDPSWIRAELQKR